MNFQQLFSLNFSAWFYLIISILIFHDIIKKIEIDNLVKLVIEELKETQDQVCWSYCVQVNVATNLILSALSVIFMLMFFYL